MCLWLLTACLGLLPGNPSPSLVVVPAGVPAPIVVPTPAPTAAPTVSPTAAPTARPTAAPTAAPTVAPTVRPTAAPTVAPTARPTAAPTTGPPITVVPTAAPTRLTPAPTTAAPTSTAPTTTVRATVAPTTTVRATVAPSTTARTTIAPSTAAPVTTAAAGAVIIAVQICNNPQIVCITNPDDENNTGPLPIDPRLGSTPAAVGVLRAPQISSYSAQVPSYDTAVKFPRSRRSLEENPGMSVKNYLKKMQMGMDIKHQIRKRQSCMCVPVGTCTGTIAAAGNIDFRIVNPTPAATPAPPATQPTLTTAQCPAGQVYCCGVTPPPPRVPIACGILQPVPALAVTPTATQARFGEYPWQAIIMTKQNDYIAGGVLIDQFNVLTVTHRMTPYVVSGTAPNVKVRLGEWDAAGTYEPVPFQEYTVTKVFTHPSFNPNTLQYDVTVLRLATPVPITNLTGAAPTINRACLPPAANATYTGQRCWVSGWGKNMFGLEGQYQQILKKVDVPIVAPATCQAQLQAARLGPRYVLDTTSFLCAGGEASKDSCTGDGGSGLVCLANGQWVVVGLVSWGLGCANSNVPAVYVNVASLLPWIRQQVATM